MSGGKVLLRNRHIYSGRCVVCRNLGADEGGGEGGGGHYTCGVDNVEQMSYVFTASFIYVQIVRLWVLIQTLEHYPVLYLPIDPYSDFITPCRGDRRNFLLLFSAISRGVAESGPGSVLGDVLQGIL